MSPKRKLAYTLLIVNTIVWGLAIPIVKPALSFTSPERFLFYRFLLAALLTFPFLVLNWKKWKLNLKNVAKIISVELTGTTLILWLLYYSLKFTSAIEASLIASVSPLFVVITGVLILKEKETKREWRGLILALLGTFIITAGPLANNGKYSSGHFWGNSLILFQNIIWAVYLVLAKKTYRKYSKIAVTIISFWVGTITFLILSLPSGNPLLALSAEIVQPQIFLAVTYMAIFGSVIGATTYLAGQSLIEISEASLFTYLQPLAAIPVSLIFLRESLTPLTVLGIILIFVGVITGEKK
ncbi:EamA family transporter [Candidatus Collierbacteria bacterium]|nr:EamA family transporter [Candidatus Collierbacteria bacterium]